MASDLKRFRLSNMTGGINTMDEMTKLVQLDSDKKNATAASEAIDIENFLPLRRGGQRTERGYEVYKDTGVSAPIRGITKYYEPDGTEHFMLAVGGNLYEMDGAKNLTSIMSVASANYLDFETAYGQLIVCDASNNARAWDGASVTTVTTDVSAPRQSRFYLDSLFMYPNNSSFVYYSDAGDIFTGYATNFVKCDNQDGARITAIEKLFVQSQIETALVVGKETAIGAIIGNGTTDSPFTYIQLNQDAGITGFRTMRQNNQDVTYLTNKGVSSYQFNQQDVNLAYTILTRKVLDQFLGMDTATLPDSHTVYDWKNSRIRFFVAEQGYTYPNVVWNYDTEIKCWYKTRYPDQITSSFVDKDGTQWLGTNDGKILKCTNSLYAFGSSPINAVYKTGFIDFGDPSVRKRLEDVRIFAQGRDSYSFGVSTRLDYGQKVGSSGTIELAGADYSWGAGVWTNDPDVYQWGGTPISLARFIPGGYFRNIQFIFTGNSSNQPFDIFSVEFLVQYMGYR